MENPIILPNDTLPSFNYLDELSKVSEEDLEIVIEDWETKHKDSEFKTILETEVSDE